MSSNRSFPDQPANYRFIGKWAADVPNCSGKAWRFTETSLVVTGGPRCTFEKIREVPGGYDIVARCVAGHRAKIDTLRLRFAESAKALLVESASTGGIGLIQCR